ncbi:Kinesin [Macleaya cordata]|uniref:Kinesin n=1 Tax=Macleaya cordata TaxID=56857 RepID=A0A200QJ73_MACCD|nr:Kinesin [Macleaya cordata]
MESTEVKAVSGGSSERDASQCVRVAVNVRPLINTELLLGCTDCISVVPGEPQVQIGSHAFTFDYVYGSMASPSCSIFDDCVAPLVDALFHGYNATVLAYGQTGSGKTYTMGTNYTGEANSGGIIPKVMDTIFSRVEELKDNTEFLIRVSFIEIFKEEVFDLLDPNPPVASRGEGVSLAKLAVPSRTPIQIRETANGGITLAGVTEPEVRTKQEMASFLSRGSISRATGSTNMNSQSSRSHAIFTISMEQKRNTRSCSTLVINDDSGDDILCAKLHLVDLAGSERAKRTGADGLRLKEGIHINRGLLALGNVISALGDEKKRKEGGHVPYRDSKTGSLYLLFRCFCCCCYCWDTACVSPADSNAEETLNTLKYANRARNIQNKAIINRDPMAAQMQRMRSQLEQMQAELLYFRGEGGTTYEELQILRQKISVLEASNAELHRELQERQMTCDHLEQRAVNAQVEKDKLIMKIESARNGKSWDEIDAELAFQDCDLMRTYVSKIQALEGELMRLQSFNDSTRGGFNDSLDLEDDALPSRNTYLPKVHDFSSVCDGKEVDSGEVDEVEKELEHSSLQDKLDKELQELDKRLEQKEAEMKRFTRVDTSVLKQHYEKKVQELEHEKRTLMKEIEGLRSNLANISSTSDDGAQKLKEEYLQKLNVLEAQVSELKKKQDAQSQLLRQKQKSDEAAKRLQEEIHRIKTQKVQLQQKIKQESEQFRMWKASREKEVLQLKKEGRRNEYEMHKLLALNQRQKMVLQRKTEEASMATKRLKELLEARKNSSRKDLALMQTLEHELEVMVRVHEVRSEYERQMEARAAMANEVAKLKEEAETLKQKKMSDSPQIMSPGARNSRIFALENMLATSSSTLVSMASQLSEAEERERIFAGKGRWNQVRSLPEAKQVMNYLFNLASSSRCQLRDKEVDCKEKDSLARELKEKVMRLATLVRQLEVQKEELLQREKVQVSVSVPSTIFNYGGFNIGLFEDMDTSESEKSDLECEAADDGEWKQSRKRLRKKKASKTGSGGGGASHPIDLSSSEDLVSDTPVEAAKNPFIVCCTCSKYSSCKTNKCECRESGGKCGESCGCVHMKCANREVKVELNGSSHSDEVKDSGTCSNTDDIEKSRALAAQGAMLLQSALAEKPNDINNENRETRRKPLSDIGNTVAKTNASKQNQRKKWRKSTLQIVPDAPPPSAQPESVEATAKPENRVEQDIPSKLPRAMRSTAVNNNPFRERNSDQVGESFENKEVGVATSRNPAWQTRDSEEKENHGI